MVFLSKSNNRLRQKAKGKHESSELLLNTLIFLEKEIPEDVKNVCLRIETIAGKLSFPLHENENQKVTRQNEKVFSY